MEQYLSFRKAELFKDKDSCDKIMEETDPVTIKQLGKNVTNFKTSVWNMAKSDIAEEGLGYKFDQNPDMKEYLLEQRGKVIGEMTRDKSWGSGLNLYHRDATKHRDWPGQNLLGKLLMKVRDNY